MDVAMTDLPSASATAERSLLIVEDDKSFLQRLARAMEMRGFKVLTAESVNPAAGQCRVPIPVQEPGSSSVVGSRLLQSRPYYNRLELVKLSDSRRGVEQDERTQLGHWRRGSSAPTSWITSPRPADRSASSTTSVRDCERT